MNRGERRKLGAKGKVPVLDITQEQIDQHMPGAKDGDLVKIKRNGRERIYRVALTGTAAPH